MAGEAGFYDMYSDEEENELEIVTTQQEDQAQPDTIPETDATSNIPAPRPENDEAFAAMMVDRLRELSPEQRLVAQREIVRVLNQCVSGEPPLAAQEISSAPPQPSAPPANQFPEMQDLQPLYGFNSRRPQDGPPPRHPFASDSAEIEWGEVFTPYNNLSP